MSSLSLNNSDRGTMTPSSKNACRPIACPGKSNNYDHRNSLIQQKQWDYYINLTPIMKCTWHIFLWFAVYEKLNYIENHFYVPDITYKHSVLFCRTVTSLSFSSNLRLCTIPTNKHSTTVDTGLHIAASNTLYKWLTKKLMFFFFFQIQK